MTFNRHEIEMLEEYQSICDRVC